MIKIVITESARRWLNDITIVSAIKIDKAMTKCAKKMARQIKRQIDKEMRRYA